MKLLRLLWMFSVVFGGKKKNDGLLSDYVDGDGRRGDEANEDIANMANENKTLRRRVNKLMDKTQELSNLIQTSDITGMANTINIMQNR